MPFQWQPFNGDTFLESHFLNLKEKFNVKRIVELGTCLGSSTLWFCEHFEKVDTVEISPEYAKIANERFEHYKKNPTLYQMSSLDALPLIVPTINEPTIFFIDSHWGANNPLIEELRIISEHLPDKSNAILAIHDFKVPDNNELGYDVYPAQNIVYDWNWIEAAVNNIYGVGNYTIYYNSEAVGAKRGCIFIHIK